MFGRAAQRICADPGLQSGPNARRTTESTLTEQARREGRHESDEAYLADASGAASPTGRTRWNQKVLIRVDATAAERGEALAGERSEIAGIGPISGAEVHALLASDAMKAVVVTDPENHTAVQTVAHLGRGPIDPATLDDTIAKAVATRGVDVASLVHRGRRPTAAQVTAIEWISGGQSQIRGTAGGTGRLESTTNPPGNRPAAPCSASSPSPPATNTTSRPTRA